MCLRWLHTRGAGCRCVRAPYSAFSLPSVVFVLVCVYKPAAIDTVNAFVDLYELASFFCVLLICCVLSFLVFFLLLFFVLADGSTAMMIDGVC